MAGSVEEHKRGLVGVRTGPVSETTGWAKEKVGEGAREREGWHMQKVSSPIFISSREDQYLMASHADNCKEVRIWRRMRRRAQSAPHVCQRAESSAMGCFACSRSQSVHLFVEL